MRRGQQKEQHQQNQFHNNNGKCSSLFWPKILSTFSESGTYRPGKMKRSQSDTEINEVAARIRVGGLQSFQKLWFKL